MYYNFAFDYSCRLCSL